MSTTVSVIVVTYNGWQVLRHCLESLRRQSRPATEVVVVDNGSTDGTVDRLGVEFPEVRLVAAGRNLGFAAGNNLGIARSTGDVVVLLNNDAVAEPDFLARIVPPLERDPRLGSVAATMVFSSAPEVVASAGIEVYRNGVALDRLVGVERSRVTRPESVFGPSAGAAAYRRAALEEVGLFPEPFFMYLEDVDLAWRLRLRGWTSIHEPGAVVRHDYSASSVEGSPRKRFLLSRNRWWVLARCVPGSLLRRMWFDLVRYDALATGWAVVRRDGAMLRGRIVAGRGLGERLRERRRIQASATVPSGELETWLRPPLPATEVLRLRRLTASLASQASGPD